MKPLCSRALVVCLFALTLSISSSLCAAEAPTGPNIFFVLSDDHSKADSGCYGNKVIRTPNIDRLAGQGMRFENAFTGTAMCSPSRSMLYTGLYPVRNGAYPNHSQVKPGTKSIVHHLSKLGYEVILVNKRHVGPQASFPFRYFKTIAETGRYLEGLHKSKRFCVFVATNDPHTPWKPNRHYDAKQVPVPPYVVDNATTRDSITRYYSDVEAMDAEVGQCMKLIDDLGVTQETLFVYAGDHGAQFPFSKWTCYDAGLNVPFIARWPGRVKAGSVSNALIHFIDFLPTAVELTAGKPIAGLDGKSFASVLLGKTTDHHKYVFGIHTTRGIIAGSPSYPIRSVRSATHKYIRNLQHDKPFHNIVTERDVEGYWSSWVKSAKTDPRAARLVDRYQRRPAEELYDIQRDPYEQNNLAADPAQRERLAELRTVLDGWMKQQGDLGIETELTGAKVRKNKKKKRKKKE